MKRLENEGELIAAVKQERASAVLLHSTWCPFCRAFRPVFEEATKSRPLDALELVLDNTHDPLWAKLDVDVVPSVLFYKNGQIIRRLDGAAGVGLKRADLVAALDEI